jgi:hypothetical protein
MDYLDVIAFGKLRVGVLSSWHDLLIALDGNQGVGEPQRSQQVPDRRVRFHLSFLTVDDEPHSQRLGRPPRRRKRVGSMGAAGAG